MSRGVMTEAEREGRVTVWQSVPPIRVGDRIIVDLPVYRKWWQLWCPRIIGHKRWSVAVTEARLQSLRMRL